MPPPADDAQPASPAQPPSTPTLRLADDVAGHPMAALNLILGRQPDLTGAPLAEMVEGGLLGLTAFVDGADPATPRWRFAVELGGAALVSAEAMLPRAALSAMLDRASAQAVLDRLSGEAGPPLRLTAQPTGGAAAAQPGMVTLAIRLDRLHAALADLDRPVLDAPALETGFFHALAAGDIAPTPRQDPAALARDLATSLPRWLPMLMQKVPEGHVLRAPPAGMARMTLSVATAGHDAAPPPAPVPLSVDLGRLLAAAVADPAQADRILRFSVPQGSADLSPLAPLQRGREPRATRDAAVAQPMLMAGKLAMSPALSVQPGRRLSALAVPLTLNPQLGALAGMVGADADAEGPVVGRIEDGVWPDNLAAGTQWHVPDLVPVQPGPTEPDAFRFELRRAGMRMDGRAGLDATITLRLRPQPGPAALAAQAAGANLRAIAPDSLHVALAIPFRDSEAQTRQQLFPAEVAAEGEDYRVTIRLSDDWARLAYGALAYDGFQTLPAELRVQSDFDGLVRVDPAGLNLARPGKLNRLPLRRPTRGGGGAVPKGMRDAMMTLAPLAMTMTIRPMLVEAAPVPVRERPVVVRRRFSVSRAQPLSMPCALHGALYRETTDAGEIAIGCREAFRLGETTLRLYRPVPEHSDASLSVLASLTQPGRFLVLPRRYVIGRHPASDGERALKPTATLYSALNADAPDQNLCVLMAALTPDLEPGRLRALSAALTLASGTPPVLDLPQDIEAEPEFLWSLPGILHPDTMRCRSGFTVTLTAPLLRAPLLRDMMLGGLATGRAILTLPDDSRVETELALDLTAIRGPDPDGPVEARVDAAGVVTLRNRLDQPLRVTGLSVTTPAGPVVLPLDEALAPGASVQPALALTAPLGRAAALSEARSFTEDISGTVVFLNLIDMAQHGLAMMQVAAELPGGGPARTLSFRPDTITQSADYVLPLTEALAAPTVRFTVTRVGSDGQTVTLPPRSLDLAQSGHVVSLIWEDTP